MLGTIKDNSTQTTDIINLIEVGGETMVRERREK